MPPHMNPKTPPGVSKMQAAAQGSDAFQVISDKPFQLSIAKMIFKLIYTVIISCDVCQF